MTRVLVLQHIVCEPPGIFADVLRQHGIGIETAELDEGDALPDWRDFDLLVVMGGPMGVYDETAHPWLAAEKRWIAAAVRAGMPYLGVCLGSQLLAASLGAPVHPGAVPEVGVLPVSLTADGLTDPVLSVLGEQFAALQWHGDTFGIPDTGICLARSPAYPHQAMRFGDVAYAVQFHVEVTAQMFEQWRRVPAYAASAQATLGASGLDDLGRAFAREREAMAESAERLCAAWLRRAGVPTSTLMKPGSARLRKLTMYRQSRATRAKQRLPGVDGGARPPRWQLLRGTC